MRYRESAFSVLAVQFASSVASEIRESARWLSHSVGFYRAAPWLLATVAIAIGVRGYFLAQPMRYDEAYTFMEFVNKGVADLFYYPLPNNHVLHTLLVRASTAALGSHPVSIRLPAFLAGLGVIPASFCLARLLFGVRSGFLASAMVAVFPYLILFDTMARGYSLVVLLSLCLAILGLRFAEKPSFALSFLIAAVSALGVLTMPSFLFPMAGLYLWMTVLMLRRGGADRAPMRHLRSCAVMTAAFSAVLYTPTVIASHGVHTIFRNDCVVGLPWAKFLACFPSHFFYTVNAFCRDVPFPLLLVLLSLVCIGIYSAARNQRWESLLLLPALAVGALTLLLLKRAIPFDRTWIYLLPFVFVLADGGLVCVVEALHLPVRCWLPSVLLVLACVWGVILMRQDAIVSYPDTSRFLEAPVIVDLLSREMEQGDGLVVTCPADLPVQFYMWYKGVPKSSRFPRTTTIRDFFIVKKSDYSIIALTDKPARKWMELEDAVVYVRDRPQQ